MKLNEPAYRLEQMDPHEWRFEESEEMDAITEKFDELLERHQGTNKLTSALRKFLNEFPDHFDALNHYAMCKLDEGKPLDAYAFAHTAVAIARRAFPPEFQPGRDRLPGDWVENRPFLRALHGLMVAEDAVGSRSAAIDLARELLNYDPEDRTGARLILPEYLLAAQRNAEALAVFNRPEFEDTFHVAGYLQALALLRLGRETEARQCLETCLSRYPQVARFILDPFTPRPDDDGSWGIVSGSPSEGWYYGIRYTWIWRTPESALPLLRELAAPIAAAGWPRHGNPPV